MFNMFKKQGTSKRSASTSSIGDREPGFGKASATDMGSQASGDMAWACECEELELDDAQLAAVVGGRGVETQAGVFGYFRGCINLGGI
jgi:hypothetical protein